MMTASETNNNVRKLKSNDNDGYDIIGKMNIEWFCYEDARNGFSLSFYMSTEM